MDAVDLFTLQYKMAGKTDDKANHEEKKSRIERIRMNAYLFLERPGTKTAMAYHLSSFGAIIGSLVVSVLFTVQKFQNDNALKTVMLAYELTLLIWFSIEFALRLWSCSYVGKYVGCIGRARFMKSVYMLVDAFVIFSTTVTAILQINASYFTILRVTRFMQIFRVLRIDRQRGDLRIMGKVVKEHSKELITCYFVGFIILFAGTYVIFILEEHLAGDDDGKIDNMANGLYWAVVTVTSVGYGDFSPKSWAGKFASAIFALIGCAFFALPAGILGSGFALQVAKQKKEKHIFKVRNPAALAIQTCWRNYAIIRHNDRLTATWHYLLPQLRRNTIVSGDAGIEGILRSEVCRNTLESVAAVFDPTMSVHTISKKSPENKNLPNNINIKQKFGNLFKGDMKESVQNGYTVAPLKRDDLLISNASLKVKTPRIQQRKKIKGSYGERKGNNNESNGETVGTLLKVEYKAALRFIMRCRYWKRIKAFRNTRYPFVNVQDVMEKTAQGHMEMIVHMKDMKQAFATFHAEFAEMRQMIADLKKLQVEIPTSAEDSIRYGAKENEKREKGTEMNYFMNEEQETLDKL